MHLLTLLRMFHNQNASDQNQYLYERAIKVTAATIRPMDVLAEESPPLGAVVDAGVLVVVALPPAGSSAQVSGLALSIFNSNDLLG